jgi:hypothetical protein
VQTRSDRRSRIERQSTTPKEIEMGTGHHRPTDSIVRVFQRWDETLGNKDLDGAMALYHEDATLESRG